MASRDHVGPSAPDPLTLAQRHHVVALQDAVAAGLDARQLAHAEAAHAAAVRRVLRLCRPTRTEAAAALRCGGLS